MKTKTAKSNFIKIAWYCLFHRIPHTERAERCASLGFLETIHHRAGRRAVVGIAEPGSHPRQFARADGRLNLWGLLLGRRRGTWRVRPHRRHRRVLGHRGQRTPDQLAIERPGESDLTSIDVHQLELADG